MLTVSIFLTHISRTMNLLVICLPTLIHLCKKKKLNVGHELRWSVPTSATQRGNIFCVNLHQNRTLLWHGAANRPFSSEVVLGVGADKLEPKWLRPSCGNLSVSLCHYLSLYIYVYVHLYKYIYMFIYIYHQIINLKIPRNIKKNTENIKKY